MDKIQSDLLKALVNENSNKQVSVIIELDLPQPQVLVKGVHQRGVSLRSSKSINFQSIEPAPLEAGKINEAQKYLEGLLDSSPRWISSAHSFVAKVNSKQLKNIVSNPIIKAVWLNRNHTSTVADMAEAS